MNYSDAVGLLDDLHDFLDEKINSLKSGKKIDTNIARRQTLGFLKSAQKKDITTYIHFLMLDDCINNLKNFNEENAKNIIKDCNTEALKSLVGSVSKQDILNVCFSRILKNLDGTLEYINSKMEKINEQIITQRIRLKKVSNLVVLAKQNKNKLKDATEVNHVGMMIKDQRSFLANYKIQTLTILLYIAELKKQKNTQPAL